jgi:putative hydrolase of the HAD superfamily
MNEGYDDGEAGAMGRLGSRRRLWDTRHLLRAIVFDYGDTLGDLRVAEQKLLETYGEIRRMLEAQAERDIPEAADLIQNVTVRVMGLVGESYARRELEELDVLALFEGALSTLGLAVPRELVQKIHEMEYRAVVSLRTVPPENLQALENLRARGLKLGLVSNAHFLPALLLEDFERLGLAQYMDAIVTSSQLGVRKPHPAIFEHVLAELEISPAEAVFVGDKMREDVVGPKELGMRAVLTHQFRQEAFDGSAAEPDFVIGSLPELLPYIDRLLREESEVPA